MRVASLASTLCCSLVLLGTAAAEEPLSLDAVQPTAEELQEIAKIRAALGPEFRIASGAFGADLKAPPQAEPPQVESPDVLAADSAASSFFSSLTPPSLERAGKFLSLAVADLHALSAEPHDPSAAEAEELRQIERKCKELADQLDRLTKLRAQKATQLR
ncbi:hypothetical protein [Blastopirellula marina]|uniref:Secreted protein n=1 Tax=Blastopirellula marina TaxID=124 RepID=A0A2S8FTQ4_9BACT|nr:hypothetical protein [Blastopirellula marina]PQO35555.1 hypothetical protein C5Y98_12985 [Blastopirellula marina]PQO48063.1 hypothetical protein C5Y93_01380 [Blastopirellula marina]PTL44194.1 hypothetical protein C5Y97_12995 [Blastopirellula marina]